MLKITTKIDKVITKGLDYVDKTPFGCYYKNIMNLKGGFCLIYMKPTRKGEKT